MRTLLLGVAGLALGACAPAATTTAPRSASAIAPADAAGIDRAIDGVYAVISGPAGQPRNWAAMRAMFTPDAKLQAITPKGLWGGTVESYIEKSGPQLTQSGFTETELSRRVEVYGNLAHAWSSYAGTSSDGKINVRGINSFQLVRQADGRWLVNSILWQPESPALPLPSDMEK